MTFRNRLQYFLVKSLRISNREALSLILSGQIEVNQRKVEENIILTLQDSIAYQGKVLKEGKKLVYAAFYKPRGIETTLNTQIPDNLKSILPFEEELFPVGRLDKESEGLLFLTNDGRLFDKTLRKEHQTEKEYLVTVDKPIDGHFIKTMSEGIVIMGQTTLSCEVKQIDSYNFSIILVQGLNRQIRRMCYKLNYEVLKLVRIRIGTIELEHLSPGEYRFITL
ncbi:23S rRNA pseudouridine2604 synthase [Pseudarcicella hirudinis]|uniref:Pseudouridine synthase n=1 Tax=Pseudarcicella hirudinis TaxID=1079859 RepID=A0A1I5YEF5_9BACT|nr:pseudouridine synthase [Pseudarcicella hirudinis]SFQ42586.1 23S rRNA pseudouridine2604 synthase [Pseudarcicella hirudinis]